MRFGRRAALALLLCTASHAAAETPVKELAVRLATNPDFRVKVQAALELGKTGSPEALTPLVAALEDENESVRAAAAAALETLGDARAVAPLKLHRLDRSAAVRAQVKSALASLEVAPAAVPAGKPRVLVKLGVMKNGSGVKSARIETELAAVSRKRLAELPGVRVLPEGDEDGKKEAPVVMVTGNVEQLKAAREGSNIVYTAKVEYVLHSMPEQSIAAKVSGSASAAASEQDAKDRARSAALRKEVLEAAIASALKRAPPALLAAARL